MLFNINKRSPRPVNSLLTAAAAAVRGVAFQESATAGTAELADGTKPIAGFMTRDSVVGGPVLGDIVYPGRLELPFATGEEGTFEFAEEVELEGSQFVDASLTGSNALKVGVMFTAGKAALATSTHFVEFMLVENMTPEVVGNVRVRLRTTPGYIMA